MIRVGRGPQVGVGSLDNVGQVLGPVVALWRDLNRLVVPLAELSPTKHAEVDGPPVRDIADGVDDLSLSETQASMVFTRLKMRMVVMKPSFSPISAALPFSVVTDGQAQHP